MSELLPPTARRRLKWALALLLSGIIAFIAFAVFYLRFVPLIIPPAAAAPTLPGFLDRGLTLRYLGITGYEVSDGQTTIILDPAVNRPTALEIISGRLQPDAELSQKWIPKADYILVNHAHYDHAIDVPEVALRTGARVVGTRSTLNLARSRGVPESQLIFAEGGERLQLGTFTVDIKKALHGKVLGQSKPMSGTIPKDAGELWFFQYTMDGALSFRLEAAGTTLWHHPSSRYQLNELGGLRARNMIIGINGEPIGPAEASGLMTEGQPNLLIPTHFDNFFQPISRGLSQMPGLDIEAARRLLVSDSKRRWVLLDYNERLYLPPDSEGH